MSDPAALTLLWCVSVGMAVLPATTSGQLVRNRMDFGGQALLAGVATASIAVIVFLALWANMRGGDSWTVVASVFAVTGAVVGFVHVVGRFKGSVVVSTVAVAAVLVPTVSLDGAVCILAALGLAVLVPRVVDRRGIAVLLVAPAVLDVAVVGTGAADVAFGSLSSGSAPPFAMLEIGRFSLGGIDVAAAGLLGVVLADDPCRRRFLAVFAGAQAALLILGAATGMTLPALVPAAVVACAWLGVTRRKPHFAQVPDAI